MEIPLEPKIELQLVRHLLMMSVIEKDYKMEVQ